MKFASIISLQQHGAFLLRKSTYDRKAKPVFLYNPVPPPSNQLKSLLLLLAELCLETLYMEITKFYVHPEACGEKSDLDNEWDSTTSRVYCNEY